MKGIKKTILIIGGVIVGLIIVISIVSMLLAKSVQVKLGETVTIKEENIEITVLSSEKTKIEDETGLGIAQYSGDFTKVKVRIKNNGSSSYKWNEFTSFRIDDQAVTFLDNGDNLPNTIEAGQTQEGYLYFYYTEEDVMSYYTSFDVVDSNTVSQGKYLFKIK